MFHKRKITCFKKALRTPIGCPWDTWRDRQGSPGRSPKDFLLLQQKNYHFCRDAGRVSQGHPAVHGACETLIMWFSYVLFLLLNVHSIPGQWARNRARRKGLVAELLSLLGKGPVFRGGLGPWGVPGCIQLGGGSGLAVGNPRCPQSLLFGTFFSYPLYWRSVTDLFSRILFLFLPPLLATPLPLHFWHLFRPYLPLKSLAHRNRSDFCDLRLRCPSLTPEIAAISERRESNAALRFKGAMESR